MLGEPSPSRPPAPGRRAVLWGRLLILAALVGLTTWTLTRSEALDEAQAAYDRADLTKALRRALDHLDHHPWSRDARRLAALCLSRLDFPDQAELHYRRLGLGSLSLGDGQVRAYGLLRANRRKEAVDAYLAILAEHPDDPTALQLLGGLRMAQSRWSEALEPAERLAKLPPPAGIIGLSMVASIQHDAGNPELAVAACAKLLELDPELRVQKLPRTLVLTQYAQDLLATGQPARAKQALERALAEKEEAHTLQLLGEADQQLSMPDEAESSWRRAVAIDATYAPAWSSLGRLLLVRGRPDDALRALERADALAPDSPSNIYSLIRANQMLNRGEEVRRLQRRLDALRAQSGLPTTGMGAMPARMP
jgi:tetratricopeptide (TPR) repeat protein